MNGKMGYTEDGLTSDVFKKYREEQWKITEAEMKTQRDTKDYWGDVALLKKMPVYIWGGSKDKTVLPNFPLNQ